jgi:dihydrofolate reductase
MTLNGYIANARDECPWPKEVWRSYYRITKTYKAIIIGRKTYEIMRAADEFKKVGNPFVIVLTRKKMKGNENVQFVGSANDAIGLAKLKGFAKVLISGGGVANSSLIKKGLVDEILIDIVPLLFGKGVRLFADADFEKKLKFTGMNMLSSQVMQLRYKVL